MAGGGPIAPRISDLYGNTWRLSPKRADCEHQLKCSTNYRRRKMNFWLGAKSGKKHCSLRSMMRFRRISPASWPPILDSSTRSKEDQARTHSKSLLQQSLPVTSLSSQKKTKEAYEYQTFARPKRST